MEKKPGFEKNNIFGAYGESLAAQFLQRKGLRVIDRNFRTPYGEIDLITRNRDTLVFVEVKARRNDEAGFPEEAVKRRKVHHLMRTAWFYTQKHPDLPDRWRLDVVAIQYTPQGPKIRWYKNISPEFLG